METQRRPRFPLTNERRSFHTWHFATLHRRFLARITSNTLACVSRAGLSQRPTRFAGSAYEARIVERELRWGCPIGQASFNGTISRMFGGEPNRTEQNRTKNDKEPNMPSTLTFATVAGSEVARATASTATTANRAASKPLRRTVA